MATARDAQVALERSPIYRFGDREVDIRLRQVKAGGELLEAQPKAFDLLVYLLENRDRVVDKDELLERLWSGTVVSDSALTQIVRKARSLARLRVSPSQTILQRIGDEVRLSAAAHFTDGSTVDATDRTVFTAEDPAAVKIEEEREGTTACVLRRGQHTVIARFLDRVVPIRLSVPLADAPVDLSDSPRRSFIDEHVLDMLATLRENVAKLVREGKSLEETITAAPTKDLDAVWGKGFLKPEQVVQMVYMDLKRTVK